MCFKLFLCIWQAKHELFNKIMINENKIPSMEYLLRMIALFAEYFVTGY